MADQRHWVAGFFEDPRKVRTMRMELASMGLSAPQVQVFSGDPGELPVDPEKRTSSDAALKNILVDGAIGGAVGVGLGALAEVAIVAANVSLFIASPLLAPLTMLGWGASLGATVGAMVGAEKKGAPLSVLVKDAVSSGQIVMVVETQNEQQAARVREAMRVAVGEVKEAIASGH